MEEPRVAHEFWTSTSWHGATNIRGVSDTSTYDLRLTDVALGDFEHDLGVGTALACLGHVVVLDDDNVGVEAAVDRPEAGDLPVACLAQLDEALDEGSCDLSDGPVVSRPMMSPSTWASIEPRRAD